MEKDNNTCVIKWKLRQGIHVNRPDDCKMENIMENSAFVWQYFVADAPAYLSKSINSEIGLVNGAPLRLHSLLLTEEDENILSQATHLKPGDEIEIGEPLAVNVTVEEALDNKAVSQHRKDQLNVLKELSVVEGDIVIPLTTRLTRRSNDDFRTKHLC